MALVSLHHPSQEHREMLDSLLKGALSGPGNIGAVVAEAMHKAKVQQGMGHGQASHKASMANEQASQKAGMAQAAAFGKLQAKAGAASLPGDVEKLLYMTVLQGAIQKAANSNNFNIEVHMSDLWTALSGLKQQKMEMRKLEDMMKQNAQVTQQVTKLVQQMNHASKAAIQNIR
jgi:hypothetical protein